MKRSTTHTRVSILGLGNVLLMDDGVGVHAARELQEDPPEGVVVAEVGTAALPATGLLEEADAVVAIDAVRAGGPPGSVYRFDADEAEMDGAVSLHDLGILGALRLMPERARPQVAILGVEPERIDYGMELTPTVRAVLPRVVGMARKMAEEWKKDGRQTPNPQRVGSAARPISE